MLAPSPSTRKTVETGRLRWSKSVSGSIPASSQSRIRSLSSPRFIVGLALAIPCEVPLRALAILRADDDSPLAFKQDDEARRRVGEHWGQRSDSTVGATTAMIDPNALS